jgi:hypothetical protein
MNKTVKKALAIAGAIAILAALAFGFSIYRARSAASSAVDAYNAAAQEYNEKSAPYNEAAAAISQANGDLQSVLDDAQKVLDEYLKNPTEENFIELTKKHTDDVDKNGKPNSDGLYTGVANDGTYVQAFTDWSIDAIRKTGDVEIVETEFGYHIMYFVKSNGDAKWQSDVKTKLVNEQYTEQVNSATESETANIKLDSFLLNWMTKKSNKLISDRLLSL